MAALRESKTNDKRNCNVKGLPEVRKAFYVALSPDGGAG